MTEQKKQLAIAARIVWFFLVILFGIITRNQSLEIFFVLWLAGLLITVELMSPTTVLPGIGILTILTVPVKRYRIERQNGGSE
jgi:hypothetical protein